MSVTIERIKTIEKLMYNYRLIPMLVKSIDIAEKAMEKDKYQEYCDNIQTVITECEETIKELKINLNTKNGTQS